MVKRMFFVSVPIKEKDVRCKANLVSSSYTHFHGNYPSSHRRYTDWTRWASDFRIRLPRPLSLWPGEKNDLGHYNASFGTRND